MNNIKELREMAQNFKVLYVEDEPMIKKSMHHYLEKLFLEVRSESNGQDALIDYKKDKFDLVITDLSMPVMDGLEMIKKIREISSSQNILVTSAHNEPDYMIRAIQEGIDGYVLKPFDYEQLNKELYKAVEKLVKYKENTEYKTTLETLVQEKTKLLNSLLMEQRTNYEKTIYSMVEMIENRDTYTAGHSKRVADYCQKIALQMGYSKDDVTKIYQAGILHDIGKIATPDAILLNPKKLNDLEYKLIQEHVVTGAKIIKSIPMFKPLVEIIFSHHERYDGKGYPRGLKGDEIVPLARIMIVADAFDAMTTNRIYKGRKTLQEAFDELEELKGVQFHPAEVDAALIALKDSVIAYGINQLPVSKLEEERFAYFNKDTLTDLYNKSYLDLMLQKNSFEYIEVFYLNDFSLYNKKYSWNAGDEFLKQFAKKIKEHYEGCLVFRVFGDDFVVLCKENFVYKEHEKFLEKLTKTDEVEIEYRHIKAEDANIKTAEDIEQV
jgi:putative nucleotidyltransferase with HDIG domain